MRISIALLYSGGHWESQSATPFQAPLFLPCKSRGTGKSPLRDSLPRRQQAQDSPSEGPRAFERIDGEADALDELPFPRDLILPVVT
ncbi:MAG: hypothetical protein ACYCO5_01795 [Acidobacteriaceae bacterium]